MELPDRQILRNSAIVLSAVVIMGVLFAYSSLDTSNSVQETIEVENNLTDEDVRIYADEGKIGYVWGWSNTPEGKDKNYKNMSLDRYTAMKTDYIAEEKIVEELKREYGENATEHIRINTEQGEDYHFGINITYDRHFNQPFSYEELKETVPDQAKGTLHYKNQSNTATIPIFTTAIGTERNYNYSIENFNPDYDGTDELIFDAKLFSKNVTPESPATIQLSLEVNTSQNISITTREPYPFQLLEASSGDQELCLGSDAYKNATNIADNYCTGSMARNGTFATATRTQQPGDKIKRNYTINYQNIRKLGSYNIEDSIRYQPKENGDERTLEYEIMFDLTKLH